MSEEARIGEAPLPSLERKLTAIFSTDVKGHSRLVGDDSEAVHTQVRNKLALGYEYIGEREVKNIANQKANRLRPSACCAARG